MSSTDSDGAIVVCFLIGPGGGLEADPKLEIDLELFDS